MSRSLKVILLFSFIAFSANTLAVVERSCAFSSQDKSHVMEALHGDVLHMADHADCCDEIDCGQCLVGSSTFPLAADGLTPANWMVYNKFLFSLQAVPPVVLPSLFRPPITL